VIPASVQYMGNSVFKQCTSLERLVFAPRTTTVEFDGWGMFSGCSHLRLITLPHNLRSIPRLCFEDCTSLTTIPIPPSVEVIEEDAFSGSAIQTMVLLENVHQIDQEAFRDCLCLQKVTFHHATTTLNLASNIFENCPSLTVLMIAPWLWPKLFASMNGHPDFICKFFRQYHTKILDFGTKYRSINNGTDDDDDGIGSEGDKGGNRADDVSSGALSLENDGPRSGRKRLRSG